MARGFITWRRLLLLSVLSVSCLFLARGTILPAVGQLLVVDEHVGRADVIIIAPDAYTDGVREAADLVRAGVASRVAVFQTPGEPLLEIAPRALDSSDWLLQHLRNLHIQAERIEPSVAGTRDAAVALREWSLKRGYRKLVVVTRPHHSRRVRRVLNRELPLGITAAVRVCRYSYFNPQIWWRTMDGALIGVEELAKLFADYLTHPS